MRIPRIVAAAAIALAVLTLCACTGMVGLTHGDPGRDTGGATPMQVPAATASPAASPVTSEVGAVSAVTVTFSDHAQQLAATDPRLSPDAVATAVEHELQAYQLYAPAAAGVHRTLVITVRDFTSSLASNAAVLGYTFHNVMLIGTVQLQESAAAGRPPFDVHARARITTRGSGAGAGSLSGLYSRFAVLTVADLRGVEPPSEYLPR